MARVLGSLAKKSSMSPKSTSACSPSDTKWEKPMPRPWAQSSMAVTRAPDCETKASSPGRASMCEKLALSPLWGTSNPMQLGPKMRNRCFWAVLSMACFWASFMPAVSTTAARVPKQPNASIKPGTDAGGVQMTASAGTSGKTDARANTGCPARAWCLRLTAYRWPA